MQQVYLI